MKIFNKKANFKLMHQGVSLLVAIAFAYQMIIPTIAKAEGEVIFNESNNYCSNTQLTTTDQDGQLTIIDENSDEAIKKWVLNRVKEAGLNPHEANIIINCESRWDTDAMGINKNHTADLGLWQINSIHKDISNSDKLDYKKATDWAIQKRLKDGHWLAWSCSRKLASR